MSERAGWVVVTSAAGVSSRAAAAPAPPLSRAPRRALEQWRHAVGDSPRARIGEACSGGLAARPRCGGKQWGSVFRGAPSPRPPPPHRVSTTRVRLLVHTVVLLALPHWRAAAAGARVSRHRQARRCFAARGQIFFPNRGGAGSGARRISTAVSRAAAWRPSGCQGGVKNPGRSPGSFPVALWQPTVLRASGGARQRSGAPGAQSVALAVRGRDEERTDG